MKEWLFILWCNSRGYLPPLEIAIALWRNSKWFGVMAILASGVHSIHNYMPCYILAQIPNKSTNHKNNLGGFRKCWIFFWKINFSKDFFCCCEGKGRNSFAIFKHITIFFKWKISSLINNSADMWWSYPSCTIVCACSLLASGEFLFSFEAQHQTRLNTDLTSHLAPSSRKLSFK